MPESFPTHSVIKTFGKSGMIWDSFQLPAGRYFIHLLLNWRDRTNFNEANSAFIFVWLWKLLKNLKLEILKNQFTNQLFCKRPARCRKLSVIIAWLGFFKSRYDLEQFSTPRWTGLYIYPTVSKAGLMSMRPTVLFTNVPYPILNIRTSKKYSFFETWLRSSLGTQIMSVF